MAKASKNSVQKHPDAKLIAACVEYGFTMEAAKYAFNIDPTDGEFAGPLDADRLDRGYALLAKAAGIKAVTLDGLAAKAGTAAMLHDKKVLHTLSETETPFLKSFAEDVCRFHAASKDTAAEASA